MAAVSGGGWVRASIVAAVALACCAAPSGAFGSTPATVEGCVSDGAQIPGASAYYSAVPAGASYSFGAPTGCYSGVLPAGEYKIQFFAPHHESQYYSDVHKSTEATAVVLKEGETYKYSASLVHLPEVTGKVFDAVTHTPLVSWKVQFSSPKLLEEGVSGFDTYSESDGTYLIDFENGLVPSESFGPGAYTACAIQEGTFENYMPACYPTPVNVTYATITPNIDFSVMEAGRVSGSHPGIPW